MFGVEVAGDHRSHAAVALNTGFCSECHLIEFLRQSDFGVFQQYPPIPEVQGRAQTRPFGDH
jgi:hypothetical protein